MQILHTFYKQDYLNYDIRPAIELHLNICLSNNGATLPFIWVCLLGEFYSASVHLKSHTWEQT